MCMSVLYKSRFCVLSNWENQYRFLSIVLCTKCFWIWEPMLIMKLFF